MRRAQRGKLELPDRPSCAKARANAMTTHLRLVSSQPTVPPHAGNDARMIELFDLEMSFVMPYAKSGLFDDARELVKNARRWALRIQDMKMQVKHLCLAFEALEQIGEAEAEYRERYGR
jgi:hypothetical protein